MRPHLSLAPEKESNTNAPASSLGGSARELLNARWHPALIIPRPLALNVVNTKSHKADTRVASLAHRPVGERLATAAATSADASAGADGSALTPSAAAAVKDVPPDDLLIAPGIRNCLPTQWRSVESTYVVIGAHRRRGQTDCLLSLDHKQTDPAVVVMDARWQT